MKKRIIVQEDPGGYILNPERSYFAVVLPEESVNLVTNPEVYDLDGFNANSGATIFLSSDYQRRGVNSLKVVTIAGGKAFFLFPSALTAGEAYTFSVDILGPAVLKIYFGNEQGEIIGSYKMVYASNFWIRESITEIVSANTRSLVIESVDARSFYADGWQCERKPYATTFISGNLESRGDLSFYPDGGYGWMGMTHRSRSYRRIDVVDGGRPVPLSDFGLKVTEFSGFGHAAKEIYSTPWAFHDGSAYFGEVITNRQFTIGGWIIGENIRDVMYKRGWLVDALSGPRCLHIQLFDGEKPISELAEVICSYQSGLEGVHSNVTQEKVAITFLSWNPYVRMHGNKAVNIPADPDTSKNGHITFASPDGVVDSISLIDLPWMQPEWQISCIDVAPSGEIYVGVGERFVRMGPSGNVLFSMKPSEDTLSIEGIVALSNIVYFLEKASYGPLSKIIFLKKYDPKTNTISQIGSHFLGILDNGLDPQAKMYHDKERHRIYVYGLFDSVTFNGQQVFDWWNNPARNLFCYEYIYGDSVFCDMKSPNTVTDEGYTWKINALVTNKNGDVWIAGDFKYGYDTWVNPVTSQTERIPSESKPWGIARWDRGTSEWKGSSSIVASSTSYNPIGKGPTCLCFDGDHTIYGAGPSELYVWRRTNDGWVADTAYQHCPKTFIMIDADYHFIFSIMTDAVYKSGGATVLGMVMGKEKKLYVYGDFTHALSCKDEYRRVGDNENIGGPDIPPEFLDPTSPQNPFLNAYLASGTAVIDTPSDRITRGPIRCPLPATAMAISSSVTPYSVYDQLPPPSLSEWEDSSEIIRTDPDTIFVSHPYGQTIRTPMLDFWVYGDRQICRMEISGLMKINRIDFPFSGKSLLLEMEVINETIVLSFVPNRPWVRSTRRGELDYPSIGLDSWPEIGLVRGKNRVIVHAEGVLGLPDPVGASIKLYWTPEYRSFDQIVAEVL